jgi:hypothetical protein
MVRFQSESNAIIQPSHGRRTLIAQRAVQHHYRGWSLKVMLESTTLSKEKELGLSSPKPSLADQRANKDLSQPGLCDDFLQGNT